MFEESINFVPASYEIRDYGITKHLSEHSSFKVCSPFRSNVFQYWNNRIDDFGIAKKVFQDIFSANGWNSLNKISSAPHDAEGFASGPTVQLIDYGSEVFS